METLYTNKRTADLYAIRPDYADFVFERIESFCAENHTGFGLAVDLCCGWGQIAAPLGKFFKQVVAVDISEHQIANAPSDIPNVEFKVGNCYAIPSIPSGAADLVVIGTAFHLLDHAKIRHVCQMQCDPSLEKPIHAVYPIHMVMAQKPKY